MALKPLNKFGILSNRSKKDMLKREKLKGVSAGTFRHNNLIAGYCVFIVLARYVAFPGRRKNQKRS